MKTKRKKEGRGEEKKTKHRDSKMKTKRKREGRKKIGREKKRERGGTGGQTDLYIYKKDKQMDRQIKRNNREIQKRKTKDRQVD